jgi:FixJ family two-component response regulator
LYGRGPGPVYHPLVSLFPGLTRANVRKEFACVRSSAKRRSFANDSHSDGRCMEHAGRMNAERGPTATVYVVDDDVSVRESLELLIGQEGWTPQLFESARSFLERDPVHSARCLVLDVTLPDLNGLEVQRSIAGDQPFMPIIFITGYGDVPMSVEAMKAGAFEFLTKPFDDAVLLEAIRRAIEISRKALHEEVGLQSLRDRHATLTAREKRVMELIVTGLLNKQVANELGISEITVKAHRGKLMRKMDADSLAALVRMDAKLRPAP